MPQSYHFKDALLQEYPEIETNEITNLLHTDIKIYLPREEVALRFYFRNIKYGEKTIGYHPSLKILKWLKEYVGNDNWKYGNEHWIPEEIGYYYFGGLQDLSYGFDFCRPFLVFNSIEHAILYKLTW